MIVLQSWGGRLREVKLPECIKPQLLLPQPLFPLSFTNSSGQSVHIPKPDVSTIYLYLYSRFATPKRFDGCVTHHVLVESIAKTGTMYSPADLAL